MKTEPKSDVQPTVQRLLLLGLGISANVVTLAPLGIGYVFKDVMKKPYPSVSLLAIAFWIPFLSLVIAGAFVKSSRVFGAILLFVFAIALLNSGGCLGILGDLGKMH